MKSVDRLRAVLVTVHFKPFDAPRLRVAVPGVQRSMDELSLIDPLLAWRSTHGELVSWLIATTKPLRVIRAQIESPGHRGTIERWSTLTSSDSLTLLEVKPPDDITSGLMSVWFRKLGVELDRKSESKDG